MSNNTITFTFMPGVEIPGFFGVIGSLFTIGIIITGLLTIGWKGTLFYFIGRYTASFILFIIDTWQMKMAHFCENDPESDLPKPKQTIEAK